MNIDMTAEQRRLDGLERAMAFATLMLERLDDAPETDDGLIGIEASQNLSLDELRVLVYPDHDTGGFEVELDADLHYLAIFQGLATILETFMVFGTHCSDCAHRIIENLGGAVANIRVNVEGAIGE